MSEAIIARGGKGIGGTVDLSGINSSLLAINTRINQIDSNVGSLWDTVNNISSGALDTPLNAFIGSSGYYNCTKSGNYWVEICGGGGAGSTKNAGSWTGDGGRRGKINNGSVYLNKGDSIYVYLGEGGIGSSSFVDGNSGGTSSFGSYLSAVGGSGGTFYWDYTQSVIVAQKMYYNSSNNRRLSASGSDRAYFGDGGKGTTRGYVAGNGNSGCCIITYTD